MTTTIVDTSALIALLYPDSEHNEPAADALRSAAEDGALRINGIVYAELAADPYFSSATELDTFLDDTGISVVAVPAQARFRAGDRFRTYLDRRGDEFQCPMCGAEMVFDCADCGATITARQHIAADFLIGAHAESADALLTFDAGFYRDYFDTTVRTVLD